MNICIVQISDIHFKSEDTVPRSIRHSLIRSIRPAVRGKDLVVVALTGDLAFQGIADEYKLAEQFLDEIKSAISEEVGCQIQVAIVPGNHDCNFVDQGESRALIAEALLARGFERIDKGVIVNCTNVQAEFRNAAKAYEATNYTYDDPLWKEIELELQGRRVKIFGLNVAWLSKIKERYGELLFPVHLYEARLKDSNADLNIVLMHHPAHWMAQVSYHALKALFQRDNTLVLSGHEHVSGGYQIKCADSEYVAIEAPALVPESNKDRAGFNLVQIDLLERRGACETIYFEGDSELFEFGLQAPPVLATRHQVLEAFNAELSDPGGNFTGGAYSGSDRGRLALADIFTYPDARVVASEEDAPLVVSTEVLIENAEQRRKIIFIGGALCGKTTILYQAFRTYHARGRYPIYVSGSIFNNAAHSSIRNKIKEAARAQYVDGLDVLSEKRESLVLLIDDIELLRRIPHLLKSVLEVAAADFKFLVATAEQGFNIAELLDDEVRHALSDGYSYEVLPFGHSNRYQLVTKWCRASGIHEVEQLERKIHHVESTLNSVIGKNLAPSYPFYLLLILQGMETATPGALQQSSYAYYYQHLITKGLNEAGLKQDKHDEVMNYVANLAWFVRSSDNKELSEIQLQGFNEAFGRNFHSVVLQRRLQLLVDARLLILRKGVYTFSYPYIYHFFLGVYLSANFDNPEVKYAVNAMCMNLRDRESANGILFLTHHNKSLEIIQKVVGVLSDCHKKYKPFAFEKDTDGLHELISESSSLSLGVVNVEQNRIEHRRRQDVADGNVERRDLEIGDDRSELGNRLREILLMFRTGEIVGQILKNYYGSMKRPDKRRLLQEVFDSPMRMLSSLMDLMGNDPKLLAEGISSRLKEDYPDADAGDLERASRRIAFDMLGIIAFSAVIKPARDVSIEELDEDIAELVDEEKTLSLKLAQIASWLVRPGNRNTDKIKKVAADLKSHNPFAYRLLQSLGAMHVRMFSLPESEVQRLCSALDIDFVEIRKSENARSGMKKLK